MADKKNQPVPSIADSKNLDQFRERISKDPSFMEQLVKRSCEGDESSLPDVRKLLDLPEADQLLGGFLAKQLENSLIGNSCGKNLIARELFIRKMQKMREELAGPNPTPLESMLADRVAVCWLSLQDTENRFTQLSSVSIARGDYWQRRIDHAHRRYLSAIKTLATVRKLVVPVVQVNIAKRQTNIVGTAPSGDVKK